MDHELTAVCQFLNELSLDEIYRLDLGTCVDAAPASDDSVCSDDETDSSSTVTGVTSDEGSDVEDPPRSVVTLASSRKRAAGHPSATASPTKKKRVPKSDLQRARQRVYDQKSRSKKQLSHKALCDGFVPALELFVQLMAKLVEKTEVVLQLLRLAGESDGVSARTPAQYRQLTVNTEALKAINNWVSQWSENRSNESGKFFMRAQAKEIEPEMAKLAAIGKQLALLTAELRWRLGVPTLALTF